jgi:hypothetical protein
MTTDRNTTDAPAGQQPPATAPAGACRTNSKDRWVKLGFLAIVVAAAAWVAHHQLTLTQLKDWRSDLPQALVQGAKEGRPVVALIYDSPTDYDYQRLQVVVEKDGNRKAMDRVNAIRVAARLNAAGALKYGVTTYPTTLLFNSRGEVETAWVGYIGETDFRQRFLKGQKQER